MRGVTAIATGASSSVSTLPTATPSVIDSFIVLSQLSFPEHVDYEGKQGKALVFSDQRDTCWIIIRVLLLT